MADTELNSELYKKMSAEQDKFRRWLLDQPPADILLHAVEYTVREDILMEMEALELPDDQARALLASPDAMSDIYKTFSKMADTGEELENSLSEEEKNDINAAKDELSKALEANNIEDIKAKTEKLTEKFHTISAKMYQQQAQAQQGADPNMGAGAGAAGAAGGTNAGGAQDDNVVDADYEVVDEDKDK